jgi:uncharacterized protein YdeI (YjbR/CyaY-like superfamily)
MDDAPEVVAEDRATWRAWLEANHATAPAAWLVGWRRGHGPQLDYGEAVEEALCFGWVDSKGQVIDAQRSRLYFAPRKAGSGWASSNKQRVERLIADGLMRPAGLAVIERAKADGSWTLLDSVAAGIVPDDLAAALDAQPPARANFDAFPPGVRKQILAWIATAKRPETRAARIRDTADRARRNERANEPPRRD